MFGYPAQRWAQVERHGFGFVPAQVGGADGFAKGGEWQADNRAEFGRLDWAADCEWLGHVGGDVHASAPDAGAVVQRSECQHLGHWVAEGGFGDRAVTRTIRDMDDGRLRMNELADGGQQRL